MNKVGRSLLVVFLAFVTGCSPQSQRTTATGTGTTPEAGSTPKSGKQSGWTYHSAEYGFSLDLPSAGWKQMTKKRFIADFWCPTRTGSPMLAGVTLVKKQTREQFQESPIGCRSEPPRR